MWERQTGSYGIATAGLKFSLRMLSHDPLVGFQDPSILPNYLASFFVTCKPHSSFFHFLLGSLLLLSYLHLSSKPSLLNLPRCLPFRSASSSGSHVLKQMSTRAGICLEINASSATSELQNHSKDRYFLPHFPLLWNPDTVITILIITATKF